MQRTARVVVVLLLSLKCVHGLSLAQRWSETWWPVGFTETLNNKSPQAITLLGAPVVVWYDKSEWRASLDRCPHRFARLSEGRITSHGAIECPYHGWSFSGTTGECLKIPQDNTQEQKACARITTLPTRERNGMVFVWTAPLYDIKDSEPNEEALKRIAMDELFATDVTVVGTDYSRDLPMDATMLAENVLDPSHLPFTHHRTISNRKNAQPITLSKLESNVDKGFTFRKGSDKSKASRVQFIAPSQVLSVTDRGNESYQDYNLVYAVPTIPGSCRLHVRILFEVDRIPNFIQRSLIKAVFGTPPWFTHLANHKILEDDNVFLHYANRDLTLSFNSTDENKVENDIDSHRAALPGVLPKRRLAPSWQSRLFQPTAADSAVVAYRRWIDDATNGFGPVYSPWLPLDCREAPAPTHGLTTKLILERGHAHTDKCAACTQARSRFQKLSTSCLILALFSLALNTTFVLSFPLFSAKPLMEFASGLLAPFSFALYFILERRILPLFERGRYPPPRNSPPYV